MNIPAKQSLLSAILILFLAVPAAFAWVDYTHMAIAKAAGVDRDYSAVGPDIIKLKFHNENSNHFYDAERNEKITHALVMRQIPLYDKCDDPKGCLPGAIAASFREYRKFLIKKKIQPYYLGMLAHYIGDLSMPLHLTVYDDFNKMHHFANDNLIDGEVMRNLNNITSGMKTIALQNENDLVKEIVKLAEESKQLGYKLRDENRDMTKEEAYNQAALSSSLLKAAIKLANEQ